MPLDASKIQELMNKPRRGGGRKKDAGPLVRDYQTWFKLHHKMLDDETGELARCQNEDCTDPRRENNPEYRGISVAKVNGYLMCRHCFLGGWQVPNPEQLTTDENSESSE